MLRANPGFQFRANGKITRRYVDLGTADLEAVPHRFSFLARSSR